MYAHVSVWVQVSAVADGYQKRASRYPWSKCEFASIALKVHDLTLCHLCVQQRSQLCLCSLVAISLGWVLSLLQPLGQFAAPSN